MGTCDRGDIAAMNSHNAVKVQNDAYHKQCFLIHAMLVAGKNAATMEPKIRALVNLRRANEMPFDMLYRLYQEGNLLNALHRIRSGQYRRLAIGLAQLSRLDVDTCTIEDLECVIGIGPKTAAYYMMYCRGAADVAANDTHVKKFLKEIGCESRNYRTQERVFLEACRALGVSNKELDDLVWRRHARGEQVEIYNAAVTVARRAYFHGEES